MTTTTHIAETGYYGGQIVLNGTTYQAFQGLQTSGSTTYGTAELFSTYIETSGPDWVAGGFIQAVTENQANTSLTIGTTGFAFEFFGGGLSDTIGSLSSTPTTTQTGLFPLAWLSAIHEGLQTAWQSNYDSYLDFAVQEVGAGTASGAAVGSLGEALSGEVFQKVREGNSFSWADGYSMVQYEEGFQSVTVGSLDSLEVLDMENFQSQRQKIAEGLRGGKWPKINVDNVSDLTVTNQNYSSSRFEVEIPSGFTTTNGPDEYNPELNFSSRRFGSKWSAVTGNQVVFGTGSGDFNLGPVLNFSYYSKDAQKWSIDITDDMVKKLFSDWEHEFDVNTDASTSKPEYASDLGVTVYPTPDNIDATQLFDEVPTDEWWTTRNKLVKTGLNESYEICASGDVMFSWEKGNKRDVLIEDEKGQKRSANYDDGEGNYTYTQRDLTESESNISGVLHETRNITDTLDTKIKTGFNLSTDITWVMGLSTDEVGFTMGGPLKPYDGDAADWKGDNYFDTNTWKGQGATGSLNLQSASWEINTVGMDTSMKMTNPTNMRITSDWSQTLTETEFEITGSSWDITIALLGETLVKPTALRGQVWAKGQAGKLSFADVRTFVSSLRANGSPEAAAKGADGNQTALDAGAGETAKVTGASWTNFVFGLFT